MIPGSTTKGSAVEGGTAVGGAAVGGAAVGDAAVGGAAVGGAAEGSAVKGDTAGREGSERVAGGAEVLPHELPRALRLRFVSWWPAAWWPVPWWPVPWWPAAWWPAAWRPEAWRRGRVRSAFRRSVFCWSALAGLLLGPLALGPALGRGFVLSYDMVFVPDPPFSSALLGLSGGPARPVPSDAVVAVAARVLPADVLQKIILLAIFVLACSGAAALLADCWQARLGSRPPLLASLAAGVFYAWNPYLAERLVMGQWAMLLGYAGLPWVLRQLCAGPVRVGRARLAAALLPAAIGGFAGMAITGLAAVPAAVARGSRPGERAARLGVVIAGCALLSLPWIIPSLIEPVRADPAGASLFAARADTPFGSLGSLALLSGIWNAEAVPVGYGGVTAACWLLVVAAAGAGYLLVARPMRLCPGLGAAGLIGLAVAALGVTAPGRSLLSDMIAAWAGFAVLRDGQQYVAALALVEAIGFGTGVAWVLRRARARTSTGTGAGTATAGAALGVLALLAPVLLLPGMAWGATGRLHAVQYPADWLTARRLIDSDPHQGTVLLLPWAQYRRYPWNGGEAVFDPWSRLLSRAVVYNDALTVGSQTVGQESAASIWLNRVIGQTGPLTGRLLAAGVRYLVIDAGPLLGQAPAALAAAARLPGAHVIIDSRDLVVFVLAEGRG
jgi:hypothetical protein